MDRHPESIFFLARSLDRGGAERQLIALAKGLAAHGHAVSIAVFYGDGDYEAGLAGSGVRLIGLHKRGRWDVAGFLFRLARIAIRERPQVLHSYLGMPNVMAALLKPLLPGTRIVWGVRASNVELFRYHWLLRLGHQLERRLSRSVDLIIANSRAGQIDAASNGFPQDKIVVIPNGIDTQYFCFDQSGRERIRAEWSVDEHEILVGLVARLDPMKDHYNFFMAAAQVACRRSDVKFVCVGDGPNGYREELMRLTHQLRLNGRLIWVDGRDDMPTVYSALDVACSSSAFGEGFSNAIGEAMACGVPCVVTQVGDSALIVGNTGVIVPPSDPAALADGMMILMERGGASSWKCRERIVSEFGIDKLVARTGQALEHL